MKQVIKASLETFFTYVLETLSDYKKQHPILINRPIVATTKGVKLCRPSELVLDILENSNIGEFVKEDGEVVKTG